MILFFIRTASAGTSIEYASTTCWQTRRTRRAPSSIETLAWSVTATEAGWEVEVGQASTGRPARMLVDATGARHPLLGAGAKQIAFDD
jgi:hypothetical protein